MSRREEVFYPQEPGYEERRTLSGTSGHAVEREPNRAGTANREGAVSIIPGLLFQHVVQFFSHNEVVDVTPGLTKLLVVDNRLFVSTALQALKEFFYRPFPCAPFTPAPRRSSPASPSHPVADGETLSACAAELVPRSPRDAACPSPASRVSSQPKRQPASPPPTVLSPATLGAAAFAGADPLAAFSPPETGAHAFSPSTHHAAAKAVGGACASPPSDERDAARQDPKLRSEKDERAGTRQSPLARGASSQSLDRKPSLPAVSCLRMRSDLARGIGAHGVWLYDETAKVITGFMDDRELCAFFICWAYWLRAKHGGAPSPKPGAGRKGKGGRNGKPGDSASAGSRGTDRKGREPAGRDEVEKREACEEGREHSRSQSSVHASDPQEHLGQRGEDAAPPSSAVSPSRPSSSTSPSVSVPASRPCSSPLPSSISDDGAQSEETVFAILCGAPPPWTWTFQQWRAFYKTPSPVLYIEPNRPPLEALLLQLQNRSATVALWNDERQAPMIVITLRALLAHAVQHLRGDLPEFDLHVHHLQVGTFENIVTVGSGESVLSVIETLDESDISAVPVVNSRGAYVGCFTRQSFLLLALQAIHNNTPFDIEQPVGEALRQLKHQEEQLEQQRQARAAAALVAANPPDQHRLASSLYYHTFRASAYYGSACRTQDAFASRAGYSRPGLSPEPYAAYGVAPFGACPSGDGSGTSQGAKKPVLDSVVRLPHRPGVGFGLMSRMTSRESRRLDSQTGGLLVASVSLRDALLRVLFSPYRRVIFLDHEPRLRNSDGVGPRRVPRGIWSGSFLSCVHRERVF
uniref:CBS domain-containing protein n=1 Tax=Neospora caninum (strain Liverpool) TaxID=572307 RepID=A0A0F7U668_NEOCL|nr:TPA: CBS domain-containing protein [Neospora caninum Liverpool]